MRNPEIDPGSLAPIAGKKVVVTGATGSFGRAFIRFALEHGEVDSIRIFSRDELKQHELLSEFGSDRLRYLIGDVRDRERLIRATRGADVVIHAAALKQVPVCELNPFEAVQTNVIGAENVVAASIENDVPVTVALSTDKAVNPVNLYGATKLCAEKIVTQGNIYSGESPARFSCVRYGNVVGSRGSVVPLFLRQAKQGELTITDEEMTRFWITLPQAVAFVIESIARMQGGEVFIPRIPSMRVVDLAEALAPDAARRIIGIRPGEKVHEVLITGDEASHAHRFDDYFVIYPEFPSWNPPYPAGEPLAHGFRYSSDSNEEWLGPEEIRTMTSALEPAPT